MKVLVGFLLAAIVALGAWTANLSAQVHKLQAYSLSNPANVQALSRGVASALQTQTGQLQSHVEDQLGKLQADADYLRRCGRPYQGLGPMPLGC